jgi:hypothetical protein
VITVMRLEEEHRRTLSRGVRPSRRFDFSAAMAEMRDQGLDPHSHALELIFGPAPTLGADGTDLERFVFRVATSAPGIEVEVELLPGQIEEVEWRELTARGWLRDRMRT